MVLILMSVEERIVEIMKKNKCSWEEAYKKEKESTNLKKFF